MIDLDDLERKARAASPGPWWRCTCCSMLYRHDGETDGARDYIAEARGLKNRSAANSDYIAAMNPAVALELIERVRRAEARASAWKRLAKRLRARVRISAGAALALVERVRRAEARCRIALNARVRVTDARSAYHGHTGVVVYAVGSHGYGVLLENKCGLVRPFSPRDLEVIE